MTVDFKMYRVFCSSPGGLDDERDVFVDTLGRVNENGGVDAEILLIPIVLRGLASAGGALGTVLQNVRDADFFVQLLDTSWGPPWAEFHRLFDMALSCRNDVNLPMKEIGVFLKQRDLPDYQSDVAEFRRRVMEIPGITVYPFRDSPELDRQLTSLLTAWRESLTRQSLA